MNTNKGEYQIIPGEQMDYEKKSYWTNLNSTLVLENISPIASGWFTLSLIGFVSHTDEKLEEFSTNIFYTNLTEVANPDLKIAGVLSHSPSQSSCTALDKTNIVLNFKTAIDASRLHCKIRSKNNPIGFIQLPLIGWTNRIQLILQQCQPAASQIFVTLSSISGIGNTYTSSYFFWYSTRGYISSDTPANHLVISEVCSGYEGDGGKNREFIELYNPCPFPINLNHGSYRIYRASKSGKTKQLVCDFTRAEHFANGELPQGITIPAFGFYLIVNEADTGFLKYYGDAIVREGRMIITTDNSIILTQEGPPKPETIIDLVGYGASILCESKAGPAIVNGTSVERKTFASSTTFDMSNKDRYTGNAQDSENNERDFIIKAVPDPQNSYDPVESWTWIVF